MNIYILIFSYLLLVLTIILSILAIHVKDLLAAVIFMGSGSLLVSLVFLLLQAPDVAMSEAAIGAALTMAIYIVAVKKTEREDNDD
ncbi:MAG: hydrogenase subunit MbhD domain-containing protein [Caldisericum exile]|uniref:hydrogenase subunit MbhD domain-containing protein n=1 Tax=Caldisericum exile TaxID=693075 RepID=UPI003C76BA44